MNSGGTTIARSGLLRSFREQPLLFIGSAVGLLVIAMFKGGLGSRRGARKGS